MTERLGVILLTYGSPSSQDDVPAYLQRVRGRPVSPELAAEFARRYRVIGGSPLVDITRRQASALELALGPVNARVLPAMRFSEPSVPAALEELAHLGIRRAVGIVLSPQWSPLLMGGYQRAIDDARLAIGPGAPEVLLADSWHLEASFIAALAGRIRSALAQAPAAPVLLTAHSLPKSVAEREPEYLAQLRATSDAVAFTAGLSRDQWHFCWQSAGHEPGEWMKPDFADLMPVLAAAGHRRVLVAPIQFLADHLEVLYDIDVGAREQAEAAGLGFDRIGSLNDDPGLIDAFAAIVRRTALLRAA